MKLQAIWFRTPIRDWKMRIKNGYSHKNKADTCVTMDADNKVRMVTLTCSDPDPIYEVPLDVPYENVVCMIKKKQALVMDKVRKDAQAKKV